MTTYEIEIRSFSIQAVTTEGQRAEMDGLRVLLADLIDGIDQDKLERGPGYGEDGMDHHSVFVEPKNVGEAVRRLNEAGYATDEDDDGEEIDDTPVLTDDMYA
jgi:hypothetical protein